MCVEQTWYRLWTQVLLESKTITCINSTPECTSFRYKTVQQCNVSPTRNSDSGDEEVLFLLMNSGNMKMLTQFYRGPQRLHLGRTSQDV